MGTSIRLVNLCFNRSWNFTVTSLEAYRCSGPTRLFWLSPSRFQTADSLSVFSALSQGGQAVF